MKNNSAPINIPETTLPRVVVIGGGFAGINFAKNMKDQPYQVVLVDQNNFHQFQPLLYQVATCGIEPDGIIYPIRKLFSGVKNFFFRMGEVEKIDPDQKIIFLDNGTISYDHLVIATGTTSNFFGNKEIEENSVGMKTIKETLEIRSKILESLELASSSTDEKEREALTNFIVVGGGPTGVETAGALAEFKTHILEGDYPTIAPELMKIYLIQSGNRILKGMSDHAGRSALKDLESLGVSVIFDHRVSSYDGDTVTTNKGLTIAAKTLIWTAGVKGESIKGLEQVINSKNGRLKVSEFLKTDTYENIYAIGDIAEIISDEYQYGHPQVAPVAMQQGVHLAENFSLASKEMEQEKFQYKDQGSMATIGRRRAVADIGNFEAKGFIAWVLWCFVHILSLVGFRNRLLVFTSWFTNYFTYDRGNRFIIRKSADYKD